MAYKPVDNEFGDLGTLQAELEDQTGLLTSIDATAMEIETELETHTTQNTNQIGFLSNIDENTNQLESLTGDSNTFLESIDTNTLVTTRQIQGNDGTSYVDVSTTSTGSLITSGAMNFQGIDCRIPKADGTQGYIQNGIRYYLGAQFAVCDFAYNDVWTQMLPYNVQEGTNTYLITAPIAVQFSSDSANDNAGGGSGGRVALVIGINSATGLVATEGIPLLGHAPSAGVILWGEVFTFQVIESGGLRVGEINDGHIFMTPAGASIEVDGIPTDFDNLMMVSDTGEGFGRSNVITVQAGQGFYFNEIQLTLSTGDSGIIVEVGAFIRNENTQGWRKVYGFFVDTTNPNLWQQSSGIPNSVIDPLNTGKTEVQFCIRKVDAGVKDDARIYATFNYYIIEYL